jgi:short-subunit dehydrogenase
MMSTERELALVTGASSGIGEAIAGELAARGYDLVLVARRVTRLRALAKSLAREHGVETHVLTADLLEPDAAAALLAQVEERGLTIDILVNNAGVLETGPFTAIDPALSRRMVDLNVGGLTDMLTHFVPGMRERGGRVLNVASIAAFQPVVGLGVYAATKAYVLSLSEALSEELRGSGVSVTALCPGLTATAMVDHARDDSALFQRLPEFLIGDAQEVAREGVEGMLSGEAIVIPGAVNQATTLLTRRMPKWLYRRLSGALVRSYL